jgi:hypothetical protein
MPPSNDTTELCRSGEYRIEEIFDMAVLFWPGGELEVGDHCYTDPQCALINAEKGWCVSGGQGLEICLFENGLPKGPQDFNAADPQGLKRTGLWRHGNPPPDGQRYWWVSNIWLLDGDLIRVLVNPLGPGAGLYDVDVRTLNWQRL